MLLEQNPLRPSLRLHPLQGRLAGLHSASISIGLVDVLRAALAPLAEQITAAFVYGSVAKGQDTAKSDIDLMVVSDSLSYADLFAALEEATNRLGRPVNPTVYPRHELEKRIRSDNAFVKRVLAHPKLWVIGEEHALAA